MFVSFENFKKIINEKKLSLKTKIGQMTEKFDKQAKKEKHLKWVFDDLQKNRNHSWYEELYAKNKNTLEDTALFYRGNKITYDEMFQKMQDYAKALKSQGIRKGMEIPISMSNTPELVYLLGAISIIGAKANIFGDDFDKKYTTEIIDGCDSPILFVEDNRYPNLEESINASHVKNIVMTSLTDSLPNGINPYERFDSLHELFHRSVEYYERKNSCISSISEFIKSGEKYEGNLLEKSSLEDVFTITYSSGSTNSSHPKAITHWNRSFIVMGRYHDSEVSAIPSMKDFMIQAHIPTHSNTDIIASISDSLMQGSTLALEPIYDEKFFPYTLMINKPNFVVATREFWVNYSKQMLFNPDFKNVKMPFLLFPFEVGEPFSIGEEKFCNKALHKVKAGTNFTLNGKNIKLPVSPAMMSVAGGDCEHGGIFYVMYRALQSKLPHCLSHKHECGLSTYDMVEYAVLDEEGNKCKPYQLGRLVANSPCTMKEYKNDPEATKKFFISDADGKVWADCNVYSFIDGKGGIHMKGRIPEKAEELPLFMIADTILKDTKNIMSCEVVQPKDSPDTYVAHVEFMPQKNNKPRSSVNQFKTLCSAEERCKKAFGEEITSKIVYHIRPFDNPYPLTGCKKRSASQLCLEDTFSTCIKPVMTGDVVGLINANIYLNQFVKANKVKENIKRCG